MIVVIFIALFMEWHRRTTLHEATSEARDYYALNLHYRAWNSSLGGVYAPADKVAPNPFLNHPQRDVTLTDGRKLTLVNPAYMTRMVFERASAAHERAISSKLVSLMPLNPTNAPNAWETAALQVMEKNPAAEFAQVTAIDGQEYLQFLGPFVTEQACLKCHEQQGYQLGDLRGAISITIPMAGYRAAASRLDAKFSIIMLLLWGAFSAAWAVLSRRRFDKELALQLSDERNRTIIETAQAGIFMVDPSGTITLTNRRMTELFGYSSAEFAGKNYFDLMTHDERLPGDSSMRRLLHGETLSISLERQFLRSDGGSFWGQLSGRPLLDAEGKMLVLIGSIADITELKRTEENLWEANLRHTEAVKAANVGLWDWNLVANKVSFSAEWKSQIGYLDHEIRDDYEEWRSRIHPDDLDETLLRVKKSIDDIAQDYLVEFRFRHRDGSYRWIMAQGSVLRDESGQPFRMLGSHVDITELKRAEENLKIHQRELLASQKVAGLGTYRLSVTTGRFESSEFMDEIFGIDEGYPHSVEGWKMLVHPDDRQMMERYLVEDVLGKRQPFDKEYRIVRPTDGEERWLHGFGEVVYDDAGSPLEMFGIIQDITERKKEYQHSIRAAQLAAIGELSAGVAHEINNPITGVINYAQLLINRHATQGKDLEILERIVKEGDRVAAIVRELLFVARDSGSQRSQVCVRDLVRQVLLLCESQLDRNGIELTTNLPEDPIDLYANAQQLEQVLLNLISNSRHAINDKHWAADEEKRIKITVERRESDNNQYCNFIVHDNGTGIPAHLINEIGKPFVTTKPAGVGTGLGLSISREIIRQHGGELHVDSEEGVFTRVTFSIPLVSIDQ
jgi:PAS domain S-box-containing protein